MVFSSKEILFEIDSFYTYIIYYHIDTPFRCIGIACDNVLIIKYF